MPPIHLVRVPESQLANMTPDQIAALFKARKAGARTRIAYAVTAAYIAFVTMNFTIPFFLYARSDHSGPMGLSDVSSLMTAMGSALSGFLGLLGFVLGYYFKSDDETADHSERPTV